MEYFIMLDDPSVVWLSQLLLDDKIDSNLMHAKFINHLDKNYMKLDKKINIVSNGEIINELTDFTANGSFDSLSKNVEYTDKSGVPFIRIKNMSESGLVMDDVKFVTEKTYEYLKKSKLEGNEVLFSKTGANLGLAMVFPDNFGKVSLADNTFKVNYKDGYDKYYLVSFFNCKYGKLWVERLSQGSAQPTIIKESFRQIKIPIPYSEIQKYIGDKGRKAEKLRAEAKELKKQAENILFKEIQLNYFNEKIKDAPKKFNWFSQECIDVRIDSQYYINETNFINNRMHKKGLKLKQIKEIADIGKGFSYSSLDDKSIPYIRISDLDNLLIDFESVEFVNEKTYSDKKSSRLEKHDLIFAITGATIGKVSMFNNEKYDKATLSADTAYIRLKDKKDVGYTLLYLKTIIGQSSILKGITGATNRHLSLEHIGEIFIPTIDNKLKDDINNKVLKSIDNIYLSKELIKQAKHDVEDLIEGNFDTLKIIKIL